MQREQVSRQWDQIMTTITMLLTYVWWADKWGQKHFYQADLFLDIHARGAVSIPLCVLGYMICVQQRCSRPRHYQQSHPWHLLGIDTEGASVPYGPRSIVVTVLTFPAHQWSCYSAHGPLGLQPVTALPYADPSLLCGGRLVKERAWIRALYSTDTAQS